MTTPLCQTTGRRKRAIARVRLREGSGDITINGRPYKEYFPSLTLQMRVTEPLRVVDSLDQYDIEATITGGGESGQSGALVLGLARALCEIDGDRRGALKSAGFLTRDPRKKERKKYGLKKARKAPQYSKR